MSRLDDYLAESERCDLVNRYYARKERERKELAGCIGVVVVLALYALIWLSGTVLIAWVLSFTVGRLAWWQWCLVVVVLGNVAGHVASWFKRGESTQ